MISYCIKRPFQILMYLLLQILFIPLALIGIVDGIHKGIINSKKLGVSFSACRALQYKWFMHYFETRPDPLTVQFIKKFPCESHLGLLATFGPLILSQRLFGFETSLSKLDKPGEEGYLSFAGPRVIKFDEIVEKHIQEVEQIVMPGAGFDLLALKYTQGKKVKVFEIDQSATINLKVETLKEAGIAFDQVTYIPVDYQNESWSEKLQEADFDQTQKTLFIWQSVSLFLEEETVKETLKQMAALCTEDSIVVQDIYSDAYISGKASKAVKRASKMIEKREPWIFGLDMSSDPKTAVASLLEECGLIVTAHHQFGEKLDIEPFYAIVEAKRSG